ncbi:MAG: biotin--[Clostridia bacterium]|nr:biotin--[acetyl-CoA-carboxylase] ligase [Clostridia bacterium]
MMKNDTALAVLRLLLSGESSGQRIADRLGVTRMAVSKAVKRLNEHGVRVEAHGKGGYTLLGEDGSYNAYTLQMLLHQEGAGSLNVLFEESVCSTNALAKSADMQVDFIVSKRQTAGRGRLERSFSSEEGGIYLSMIARPVGKTVEAIPFTVIAAGVAVREVLKLFGVDASIKWVNDVKVNGKKVCGILSEAVTEGQMLSRVVVGVGLNVNNTLPDELQSVAASLTEYRLKLPLVAARLMRCLLQRVNEALRGETAEILSLYREGCETLGQTVTVQSPDGTRFEAVARGINEGGVLLVEREGEVIPLYVGEIVSRRQ